MTLLSLISPLKSVLQRLWTLIYGLLTLAMLTEPLMVVKDLCCARSYPRDIITPQTQPWTVSNPSQYISERRFVSLIQGISEHGSDGFHLCVRQNFMSSVRLLFLDMTLQTTVTRRMSTKIRLTNQSIDANFAIRQARLCVHAVCEASHLGPRRLFENRGVYL